ncbi:MAG: S41 family peptidase [Pyrinomonadaceae bacterium]
MMHLRNFLQVFALAGSLLLSIPAQEGTADNRRETFEIVWSRVKERHFDPNLNGIDWDAVRLRYAPRVLATTNEGDYYRVLNEMLGELKQSHFVVFPPSTYAGEEVPGSMSTRADIGIEVQVVQGHATITRVYPSSPGDEAGLRPGYLITGIGDDSTDTLVRNIAAGNSRPAKTNSLVMRAFRSHMRGDVGSALVIRYLDSDDVKRVTVIQRRLPRGLPVKFGELPVYHGYVSNRWLPNGIGYLRLNLFMLPLLDPFREAVRSFHDARAIILDLRGAPGGEIAATTAVAGFFHTNRASLGTTRLRQGELRRLVLPQPEAFSGPLVILVDEGTYSAAETFAAALQENGRAKIVGRPTVGGALPSVIEKLPTGARLQYAIGEYRTPKGALLEGRGIQPDVPVEITRKSLIEGRDPILESAVDIIKRSRGL